MTNALILRAGTRVKTRFDVRELVELRKNENQELYVYWESRKAKRNDCGGCHPDVFRGWMEAEAAGKLSEG